MTDDDGWPVRARAVHWHKLIMMQLDFRTSNVSRNNALYPVLFLVLSR